MTHDDLAAVLELGALFGALASGILADRFSRRHSIFLACGMHTFLYRSYASSEMPFFSISRLLYWLWAAMWSGIPQPSGTRSCNWWFWCRSSEVAFFKSF